MAKGGVAAVDVAGVCRREIYCGGLADECADGPGRRRWPGRLLGRGDERVGEGVAFFSYFVEEGGKYGGNGK